MKGGKVIRIFCIVGIVALIIAAIVASMNMKQPNSEKVWDTETTVGNIDAKNYFIIYSDIACPYCVAFENAIIEHHDEFYKYIEANDILIEVRLSDFLYEFGESNPIESRYGAEAIFCAKKEGKFWDYYDLAITEVWKDYFEAAGKGAFSEFNKLKKDYWIELGKQVGLGDDFAKCVTDDEVLEEVMANARRSAKQVSGMPQFIFNEFKSGGFDLSWGWEYVLMYFEAGLKS